MKEKENERENRKLVKWAITVNVRSTESMC
jgi:hypothetical protein